MAAIGDVSSTLLLRYYGSKTALFEAALIEAMPIGDLLATTERSQFGEVPARAFLDTRLDIKPPSIIALATGDADARDVATRLNDARILAPMAKRSEGRRGGKESVRTCRCRGSPYDTKKKKQTAKHRN